MKKGFLFYGFLLFIMTIPTGCAVVDYIKKNCTIETQVSGQSFICLTCDFNNATPALKDKIEKKLNTIQCDTIH